MRRYELMLLFRPDLEDDKLQSAVEKVTRAIVNGGGTLTKVSPWGKRRMAYDIQHFREASYFLLHFDIAPSAIRDIERGMLISEEILRHLVTVLVDHGAGAADEELAPAAVPADEADGQTGAGNFARADRRPDEGIAEEGTADEPADEPDEADEASDIALDEAADSADVVDGATAGDEQTEEAGTAVEA
ncbi:MAG: 30S ribosomal protein S6 [Chloroflexota bacterium]